MTENFNTIIKLANFVIKDGDSFKIPSLDFYKFGEEFVNTSYLTTIRYNSLMRFYLYMRLLKYNGNEPTILNYIDSLKNKDIKKIEILNKIPNNNIILNRINRMFKLNFSSYNYNDLNSLKFGFISNYQLILSDKNILEYIRIVCEVSEKASNSEKIVRNTLNELYSKNYEITCSNFREDLNGMDLWIINRETGKRQSMQVKNISDKVGINITEDLIHINNSRLDIDNYNYLENNLKYNYLALYVEKNQKIYILKSSSIDTILKSNDENYIKIKLKTNDISNDDQYKIFKIIDISQKI